MTNEITYISSKYTGGCFTFEIRKHTEGFIIQVILTFNTDEPKKNISIQDTINNIHEAPEKIKEMIVMLKSHV